MINTIEYYSYSNKEYDLKLPLVSGRDNGYYRTLYSSSKNNKYKEDEYILDNISLYEHSTLRSVSYKPRSNNYSLYNNIIGSYFDSNDVYLTIYSDRRFPLTMAGGRKIKSEYDYENRCYKETISFSDSALSLRTLKRIVASMENNINSISSYPGIIWFKVERGPTYHE